MKTASTALINFLAYNSQYLLAELHTVTLATGAVYRWTNGPRSITSAGQTYGALGPLITRGRARTSSKLEVGTLEVTLEGKVLLGSTLLAAAAANGAFDGARWRVAKLVMPTYGDDSLGEIEVFSGRVAGVEPSHAEVKLTLKHDLEILNTSWPRNLIQPGCPNQLFDAGCGVARRPTYGTATGGDANSITAALGMPAGWFDLGVIAFTSGPLLGVTRTVKRWDGGTITPSLPLPGSPAGCAFAIVPGCDKAQSTCGTKWGNLARFRGCPFVPKPEQVR